MSYTAVNRGQHKLHVQIGDKEMNGSPFTITTYPEPNQMLHPIRIVTDLNGPYGIACNSGNHIIVSERVGHKLSILHGRTGHKVNTIGARGNGPTQMQYPKGVATDNYDNIYVSSQHKLQKFNESGQLVKYIGQRGSNKGDFDDPRGVTIFKMQVHVCDSKNHRIQVFDLDLNFVRSIESPEIITPLEVKFDPVGNMYLVVSGSGKVQVMDSRGTLLNVFGEEGEGKLLRPSSLHIVDKYVYVSDVKKHCILVYDTAGKFVTSLGKQCENDENFCSPYCITSTNDGFIHICDSWKNRIQTF